MTRRSWVYIDGVAYEKGAEPATTSGAGPTVLRDLPDFVSPIDGRVYSGRTGLRDHCARHDVVPTADLKGLPTKLPPYQPNKAEIRESIQRVMYQKGYL